MELTQLLSCLDAYECIGENKIDINKVEYDSRNVEQGDLFVCIVGNEVDGHDFAQKAVTMGAAALLVEHALPIEIPQIIVADTRKGMAKVAAQFYGHPATKMTMIGITGTNGKTTNTYMLKNIAESAGKKVGLIGTITNMIGETVIPSKHSTPESVDLQALLARMVEEGVDICCMEVSSHALTQSRAYGILYDVAIFTNLTLDHLNYHKTFENYFQAKRLLFDQCKKAVINADDEYANGMVEGKACEVTRVGIRENADISAKSIDIVTEGVSFDLILPDKSQTNINLKIPGLFSVYNAMTSAAAAYLVGFSALHIKQGLEELDHVSGRLERLPMNSLPFSILLDYAHTPDALENVLKTITGFAKARVITVFGCGGGRDTAKRPIMGEVAGRYSDFCIITDDNPRFEEPMDIIRAIEEGMKKSGCEFVSIQNRRDAIAYAIQEAKEGDIILLAGKGHETYQEVKGVQNHFDEKEIVAELIEKM